ncbi:hypothetical protein BH11MYX2_BH11MYX2_06230 [soil metagenome]
MLGIAAVATLGLGVYLFFAVSSTPPAGAVPLVEHHDEPKAAVAESKPARTPDARPAAIKSDPLPPTPDSAPVPSLPSKPPTIDVKKDDLMSQANKAYDAGELDDAMSLARKVLEDDPDNVRMRRIMVSSSCILEDATTAQKHYLLLPPGDRETMRIRCARYGVTFTES